MRPAETSLKPNRFNARGAAIIAGAGIVLIALIALSGANFSGVLYRLLTDGAVLVLWLASAWGWGRVLLLPVREAREFVVTSIATGLGFISLVMLGIGLCGLLNSIVAWGVVLIGIVALGMSFSKSKFNPGIAKPPFGSEPLFEPEPQSRRQGRRQATAAWIWLLAMPCLGIALFAALVPPGILWGDEPHGYDVVEYHLQVPREWYEAGKIIPLKHNAFSYFPFNVEMHYLLAMELRGGPWAGMYLAQLMHVAFCALACAAVWEMTGSHLAGALMACVPWTVMLAPMAYNEGGVLLYAALAIGWALRGKTLREFALAGALAGFACGVKLTGVPILLVALPVMMLLVNRSRRNCSVLVLAGVVTFSPWLVRNVVWTGNPVFPEAQSVFGKAHFSDDQSVRWKRAHEAAVGMNPFRAMIEQVGFDFRYGFVLLPLAIVAIALSRGSTELAEVKRRETIVLSIMLIALLAFWLFLTHLQGRFFIMAIPICAMLVAQIQSKVWQAIVTVAALVMLIVTLVNLLPRLEKFASVIGVEDLRGLTPPVLESAPKDAKIYLIGDAKAFFYQRPMSKLIYRTVFDVDAKDKSIIAAWLGGTKPSDGIIVVDPIELQRFSKTYYAIPPLSDDIPGPRDQAFILSSPAPR